MVAVKEDNTPHQLYKITNMVNSKVYVGVTKNPEHRKVRHFKYLYDSLVNKAVKKYGIDSFKFEILCIGTAEYIYNLEVEAIKLYNSNAVTGHGYNLEPGGRGGKGSYRGPVNKRVDDKSVFVSGFWFPNKRTALTQLKWGDGIFSYRKRNGLLGETCVVYKHHMQNPVFVTGFWFPSKMSALKYTSLSPRKYEELRLSGSLGDPVINNNKPLKQD